MIDLTRAINCISVQKENGTYRKARIGRITEKAIGLPPHYQAGEVVLFYDELTPEDSRLGIEPKPTGRVTIESPLTQAELDEEGAINSLTTTNRTMIGVPARYVEEIKVE